MKYLAILSLFSLTVFGASTPANTKEACAGLGKELASICETAAKELTPILQTVFTKCAGECKDNDSCLNKCAKDEFAKDSKKSGCDKKCPKEGDYECIIKCEVEAAVKTSNAFYSVSSPLALVGSMALFALTN